jgi:predicted AAA+ superfamily ATPase
VILEAHKLNSYCACGFKFSHFHSHSGLEVDLVLEKNRREPIFVEIKSTSEVTTEHLKSLVALQKEFPKAKFVCLSNDPIDRVRSGIEIRPWNVGLQSLFKKEQLAGV